MAVDVTVSRPEVPPAPIGDPRYELACQYLSGEGLEIGALHLASLLPARARARYVDRMSVPELKEHYPELADLDLAPVQVIDDGEKLETVEPESVDFIVANHFFEHCEDPIRTLETHLSKLRPGGILFYAIPDKRYTFDFRRDRTTLQHLIDDHEHGPERSRSQHYLEWTTFIYDEGDDPPSQEESTTRARELEQEAYSIHFHVWTEADLVEFFFYCQQRFDSFEFEAVRRHWIENIFVLRKRPEPLDDSASSQSSLVADEPSVQPPARALDPTTRTPVALAGLRCRLDDGSARGHWSVGPDGVDGRAWVVRTEAPVTVPLILDGPVMLSTRARLLPHDWRDSVGGVDAWISVRTSDGEQQRLWATALTPATEYDGVSVECVLPANTTELSIGASQRDRSTSRSTGQFVLVEPYLSDPRGRPGAPRRDRRPPAPPLDGPTISVLCPVHDPPVAMLDAAVESVLAQTYGRWELVLADDGSRDPLVIAALDRWTDSDSRITLTRRPEAGGISSATNDALAHANGEYFALLDHDDLLDPHALAYVVDEIVRDPSLDMVYTDEAILEDGRLAVRHFKSDWSPETIAATMYVTHLGVYRRSLANELGGFRSQFDGTQDYDFVLRLGDRTDRISHIPEVLYYWRAHHSSTAGGAQAKPYAYAIQPATIGEHLRRRRIDAEVQYGPRPGVHRIVHRVDETTDISLVVAVTDMAALPEAASSWAVQPHRSWEAVVSAPPDQLEMAATALRQWGIGSFRIVLVAADPDHTPTEALQAAATRARCRHLLLMQTPMLGLTHDWLARLLGYTAQVGIGAAAPVVLTNDDRIAHSGIAIPDGVPVPLLHGLVGAGSPAVAMNVVAADGALAVPAAAFNALGGLDTEMGSLALADYCLRASDELSLRTVVVPDVRLRTIDADRTTNDLPHAWELGRRFAERHRRDPFYSPNFRPDRGDFHQPSVPEQRRP